MQEGIEKANKKDVRVISLHQPYASLWLMGIKFYETRPKPTSWKGTYLIHATKTNFRVEWESKVMDNYETRRRMFENAGWGEFSELPTGAIIGAVDMVGCHEIHKDPENNLPFLHLSEKRKVFIHETERLLGGWYPSEHERRWAWEVTNRRILTKPIPYKGSQGYYAKYKGDFDELEFMSTNDLIR